MAEMMYRQAGWYRDRFAEMHADIQHLLDLQISYRDSDRSTEKTSRRNIYDRYHDFRDRLREELPHEVHRIPVSMYAPDEIGSLRERDLKNLISDVKALESILADNCASPHPIA